MSNMQVFYKKIKAAKSESTSPYLSTLEKLTQLNPLQMGSLATDLLWIDWGSPVPAINANH